MNFNDLLDKEFSIQATHLIGLVFVLGLAVGFSGGATVSDFSSNTVVQQPSEAENTGDSAPSTVDLSKIDTDDQPKLGSDDAPVKMVIYEDFQCPFCERFENGAMPQVVNNYVEPGDVQVIWKDFPLQRIHPWATSAAETMECVYRQDEEAFWSVKQKVFDNQKTLDKNNVEDRVISWASEEGVSTNAVRSCLENGNPQESVKADMQEATSFEAQVGGNSFVSGTPSVVIYAEGDERGQPLVGAQPYQAVKQAIDSKREQ